MLKDKMDGESRLKEIFPNVHYIAKQPIKSRRQTTRWQLFIAAGLFAAIGYNAAKILSKFLY